MRERSEGEGVLVDVVGLFCIREHVFDEVSTADVVREIAEEMVAEGIVADVLDERAAVSVCVGLAHLIVRSAGKAGEEQRANLGFP